MYPLRVPGALRSRGGFHRALVYHFAKSGVRDDLVDQPPVDSSLAANTLFDSAEYVRQVAAHLAFVYQAGQSSGAGQHCQQRHFRQ